MFKLVCFLIRTTTFIFLGSAFSSHSATLQVYPVNIDFSENEKTKAVYVSNAGKSAINAQIRVFLWQQDSGENKLIETREIIVSPPLTDIPPGQQQMIRIILPNQKTTNAELSYRLIIDELPGSDEAQNGGAINFLLRYSLPIFIYTPSTPVDNAKIHVWIDKSATPALLKVSNENNQHIKLSDVSIINQGKKVVVSKGLLGYVLANNQMQWPLPAHLSSGKNLEVTLNEHNEPETFSISTR
ncbi:molecular chaperone (plasmid) [Providencia rettgeri]|uniref:fimbrial biogenesis chaperone n=1 Tax=Providencia rettgeri TaxID=587 RepID=UPI001CA75722|nr:molecular chaperone [Providencia rettgeri]QZY66563.1 molecular chaperone [Providencia rettgeri]